MADDSSAVSDEQLQQDVIARAAEVESFLKKKDKVHALQKCLESPPVNCKSQGIKDANAATVEKVLSAITDSEFADTIADLDFETCDVLMKYIYKFLEKSVNCAALLKFHALVLEKAGPGSIIRVMTDRKTV